MEQITASAGSGKTYTLTRRFLVRLAEALPDGGPSLCLLAETAPYSGGTVPYSLGGILAATFTNKAATEMLSRVIRELKQQALATGNGDEDFPLTPGQARKWLDIILRRYDALNIRTIDSLLNLLVRLNALSLSLPPDFSPLFSLDETLEPLYDALLDQADGAPGGMVENLFREACRSMLFHNRAKGVAAGNILRNRLRELIDLNLGGAALPEKKHGEAARVKLATLHAEMTETASALARLAEEERLSIKAHAYRFLINCRECRPFVLPSFADSYARKENFDDWLNRASQGKASDDAIQAFQDFGIAYRSFVEQGPALLTTMEFMPLVALAKELISGLDTIQRENGTVPASRLPALALESLESGNGVSDAFCRLGDSLVHLLFDEFQDTSLDQWRAILPLVEECLSHGGSLTYVGDVKQAIYGWRGGNAELFNAVAKDTALTAMLEDGAKTTTLPCNWRSAPAIVHTNNRIFGQLGDSGFARKILGTMLPASVSVELFSNAAQTLVNAFAECRQQVTGKNMARNGYVRLTRIEAQYAADLMTEAKKELWILLTEEILPRRGPGEVAILVRKNDEAADVASWLAEWQIPVVTEHSFRLGDHPLITRMVDALAFLEYPMDDAAFWSAVSGPELFGPSLGLPPEELMDWLVRVREFPDSPPLFTSFKKEFPEAWQRSLGLFSDQADLLSAYDMVRELIRYFRLFERHPEQAPFLKRFSEVAFAAENKGCSSLSAFLEYWADTGVDERVPMPENMDAVRILSMHKAKGLEFPVVIAPFNHQTDPQFKPLIIDESSGLPLIAYRNHDSADYVRSIMEQLNLLYVTWTRPTEELYAFITQSRHSVSHSSLGKALGILLESTPFTDGRYEYGELPAPASSSSIHELQADPEPVYIQSLTDADIKQTHDSPLMAWLPRLKIFRNPLGEKGFSERQRGLLAHACLEALHISGDAEADITRAIDRGLRAFPVPMPDPEFVRRDMEIMLAWYVSLPEAAFWMRHGSPEQPVMDNDGSLRRMDLVVNCPSSPLLAVEYKSGQPSPEHIRQVKRYLSILAGSVRQREPEREIAGVIVYLDLRTIVPVACPSAGEFI